MFESACNGLAKGYMDYQNDIILPLVLKNIKEKTKKI